MSNPTSPNSKLRDKEEICRLRANNIRLIMEYDRVEEINMELEQNLASSWTTTTAMRRENILLRADIQRLHRIEASQQQLIQRYDNLRTETAWLRDHLTMSENAAREATIRADDFERQRDDLLTECEELDDQIGNLHHRLADEERSHEATRNVLAHIKETMNEIYAEWNRHYERLLSDCQDYLEQIDRRLQQAEQRIAQQNGNAGEPQALTLEAELREAAFCERMQNAVVESLHNTSIAMSMAAGTASHSNPSWMASGAALILNLGVSTLFNFISFVSTVRKLFTWRKYRK